MQRYTVRTVILLDEATDSHLDQVARERACSKGATVRELLVMGIHAHEAERAAKQVGES